MENVFISIGSNLGDRISNCREAIKEISEFSEIVGVSSLYETEPVGKENQPNFINCAAKIKTDLTPDELLKKLNSIEDALGRVRTEKWSPRTIDIDIIFYNNLIINESDLIIPHPRAHLRKFVLNPIGEIEPDYIHPALNLTVSVLIKKCKDSKQVVKLEEKSTINPQ